MAKFNKKKSPREATEVNFMGERAYKLDPREELVATVMTTFLQNGYYEKEEETTQRIKSLLDKSDPLFAAKLALYARNDGNMRSVTHLIAAYIAQKISGSEWGKRFYEKIAVRPDDMSEILSCYASMNKCEGGKPVRKIPNAIKKGFKSVLEGMDPYRIDKYKMERRELSLVDLVNLLHPTPTQKNEEAYRRLMAGESLDGLYDSKILEKEMSKRGSDAKTADEKEKAKKEAIESVIENVGGMPIFNLVRNLRNIILHSPDSLDTVCESLRNEKKILNSRLLPFRFASAYHEVESMEDKDSKSSIMFESDVKNELSKNVQKVLSALEDAIEISCKNIPCLDGNVAVLIDHSGSCRGDGGGSSKVSAFSKTTTAMIGNLFGSMLAWRQKDVYIGLFGDRLIPVKVDRNKRLLEFNEESFNEGRKCGPATEAGIYDFMRTVVNEKKRVDNVVVFSDCQIGENGKTPWYGVSSGDRSGRFQELFKEFMHINPQCHFVVVNLRQYGSTNVFNTKGNVINIAGWSDKIFDTISANTRGYAEVIKKIEAIEI